MAHVWLFCLLSVGDVFFPTAGDLLSHVQLTNTYDSTPMTGGGVEVVSCGWARKHQHPPPSRGGGCTAAAGLC